MNRKNTTYEKKLSKLLAKISQLPDFTSIQLNDINDKGLYGNTPMHIAAIWGDTAAIEILADAGADLNSKGEHGYTPLHEAVEQKSYDAVKLLLNLGCSVTKKNDDGLTAFQLAKVLNYSKIVELFEEK